MVQTRSQINGTVRYPVVRYPVLPYTSADFRLYHREFFQMMYLPFEYQPTWFHVYGNICDYPNHLTLQLAFARYLKECIYK